MNTASGLGFFWESMSISELFQNVIGPALLLIAVIGLGFMLARKNRQRTEK